MLPEQITTTKLNDSTFGKDIIAVINGQQQQQSGHQSNSTNNITVIKFIETQHHHHRHRHQSKTIASFDADSSVESDAVGPSESHCRDESNSIQRSSFIFCDISNWISYQDNIADVHHRKGRRLNGFQLPLHPLQVFGWCVLVFFAIASFSILIPHFSVEIRGPLYGFIAGLYIVHVVSHLIAVLIDPADRELRRLHRNDRIVPEFNRAKHAHVIENGRCHLCNIRTSSQRTKHCSVCNKCVGKFDHHCKWLNHCIGSRNYVAFLMCVVSAVIATLVILAAAIAQIILYHFNPEWLSLITKKVTLYDDVNNYNLSRSSIDDEVKFMMNSTDFYDDANSQTVVENGTMDFNDTLAFAIDDKNITQPTALVLVTSVVTNGTATTATTRSTGIGLNNTMFLIFVGFIGVLAAITAGLLLHLCFFHIYISFLGLTTYEYIRNHRQQANVKSTMSTIPKNETAVNNTPNIDPSIEDLRQIYFCSNLSHPNSINMNYQHLFDANGKVYETDDRPTSLHCCANSREYHQTAMKTYYMCSTLEGDGEGLSVPVASPHHQLHNDQHQGLDELFSHQSDEGETYHCCSKFTSKAEIGTTSSTSSSTKRRHSYLQFTEQCSFCTLRIRPSVAGRKIASSVVAQKIDNATPTTFAPRSAHDHQRCCGKTISKHHRWRRKWNCCSSVPDSPDVPNDIITAFAMEHQRNRNGGENRKSSSSQIPVHFIKSSTTTNDRDGATDVFSINSQRSVNNLKASSSRGRFGRPWPVGRLRHMIRMINRYRRPQCQHNNNTGNTVTIAASSIKQNQIRPLYSYSQQYDSSSPPPPSSTSTTTTSDRSDRSICSDQSLQTIETILPTSVIRDETSTTYIHGLTMPPALPPPTRRRIPNPTDLEELAETLRFSHIPISNCSSSSNTNIGTPHRLPSLNSVYRRQRRKHFLRTRSPTLSPIHESGLSNPTSPQPCRHTASNCSPAVVINNICSQMAKTSSNGSLNSSSSNSSSTSAN